MLRGWCKQADVDAGNRLGTATDEASKIEDLEQEVRELERVNEILLAAWSFFARELDPRLPWRSHSSRNTRNQSRSSRSARAAQARLWDRPVYLLRQEPAGAGTVAAGRGAEGTDQRVFHDRKKDRGVGRALKVSHLLTRDGVQVPDAPVERLMRELRLQGRPGKKSEPQGPMTL
jgi:hypothetical protein